MRRLALVTLGATLACGGLPDAEKGTFQSTFQGEWYSAGKRLHITNTALGDWQSSGIDGTFAADTFVFSEAGFEGRNQRTECSGTLRLQNASLVVELTGACSELNGEWSRQASTVKTKKSEPRTPKPNGSVPWCTRYVSCICDLATDIRYRTGEESYLASCDVARAVVDLGASPKDCREGLQAMSGWFAGIDATYRSYGVKTPAYCGV